ncbi:MAG TPA: ComF family protein [Candidatus Limnocylindrales bacterium]|nr:ComF family protein [Candidatus Limnocylindrales bacterium]
MFSIIEPGLIENEYAPGWMDSLMHLIFPERCLLCRTFFYPASGLPLCHSCSKNFAAIGQICPQCERMPCGAPECTCRRASQPLRGLFALSWYGGQFRQLLHDLKFKKKRFLARPLGRWLGMAVMQQNIWSPNVIVPIPMHKQREIERGFNQSFLIANYAAQVLKCPVVAMLEKRRPTSAQTGISRQERFENIRGAFDCSSKPPEGTRVLLIDDIYTTGATMKEAAAVLQNSGAKVHGAVIAYNLRAY